MDAVAWLVIAAFIIAVIGLISWNDVQAFGGAKGYARQTKKEIENCLGCLLILAIAGGILALLIWAIRTLTD